MLKGAATLGGAGRAFLLRRERLPERSGAGAGAILAPCNAELLGDRRCCPQPFHTCHLPPHRAGMEGWACFSPATAVSYNLVRLLHQVSHAARTTAATKQGRICRDPHSHSARRCKPQQQRLSPARWQLRLRAPGRPSAGPAGPQAPSAAGGCRERRAGGGEGRAGPGSSAPGAPPPGAAARSRHPSCCCLSADGKPQQRKVTISRAKCKTRFTYRKIFLLKTRQTSDLVLEGLEKVSASTNSATASATAGKNAHTVHIYFLSFTQ